MVLRSKKVRPADYKLMLGVVLGDGKKATTTGTFGKRGMTCRASALSWGAAHVHGISHLPGRVYARARDDLQLSWHFLLSGPA